MASDFAVGFSACVVASILFGCMFVPVKRFDPADGMFVQWVMSAAIFIVGLIIQLSMNSPTFYPLAMVGGALFATGNITAVPIIQLIGMGLGVMLWSTTNLIAGWASGRFGWFGLTPQIPRNVGFNYAGLTLSILSAAIFAFVKSTGSVAQPVAGGNIQSGAVDEDEEPVLKSQPDEEEYEEPVERGFLNFLSPVARRFIGIGIALFAGIFYGLTFTPVIFIQDHNNDTSHYPQYYEASTGGLPYVFAHYCGIFLTSTIYFVIYCLAKRNRPIANPQLVLPAFICGTFWAVAQAAFFVANERLTEAVTFPIITRVPGVIAALWGVFCFKEITGKKNLIILAVATLVTVGGGILSGLSNVELH